jgi:hypothetical protein
MSTTIGCLPVPCVTCPYRKDVPSGVWHRDEYQKLVAYDAETAAQPAALFMCHQQHGGLCTGWVQSHAARDHRFDLLALRLHSFSDRVDVKQISNVARSVPAVALFRTGAAAMRHGLKRISNPGRKAVEAIASIVRKRRRKESQP